MDPDTALENARRALSAFLTETEEYDTNEMGYTPVNKNRALEHAKDLAKAFEAIDQWMTKGGFPPRGWTKVLESQP